MTRKQLIDALEKLGLFLRDEHAGWTAVVPAAKHQNGWFTPAEVHRAITSLGQMLHRSALESWLHDQTPAATPKNIGLVLAGNIPMVGFHDVLCVLASGNNALIKLSSGDQLLIPYVLERLVEIEPAFAGRFSWVERLTDFDAVIATGSNNTSRYFDYYFAKVPHVIRRNRTSVAVLRGDETTEQLHALGHDLFDYYGLGCRNVSKLFVPSGYSFDRFFEAIESFKTVGDHHKYNNNYDYHKSIYLVNLAPHLDNGFVLLKEDSGLASPLAVVYFDYYTDLAELENTLNEQRDAIQCVVGHAPLQVPIAQVAFGNSQQPALWDYADGIDTMNFLNTLA